MGVSGPCLISSSTGWRSGKGRGRESLASLVLHLVQFQPPNTPDPLTSNHEHFRYPSQIAAIRPQSHEALAGVDSTASAPLDDSCSIRSWPDQRPSGEYLDGQRIRAGSGESGDLAV